MTKLICYQIKDIDWTNYAVPQRKKIRDFIKNDVFPSMYPGIGVKIVNHLRNETREVTRIEYANIDDFLDSVKKKLKENPVGYEAYGKKCYKKIKKMLRETKLSHIMLGDDRNVYKSLKKYTS